MRGRERRLHTVATRLTVRQRVVALLAAEPGDDALRDSLSDVPLFVGLCDSLSYGGDFIARARRLGIETILTPVRRGTAQVARRTPTPSSSGLIGTLRRECLRSRHRRQRTASEAGAW